MFVAEFSTCFSQIEGVRIPRPVGQFLGKVLAALLCAAAASGRQVRLESGSGLKGSAQPRPHMENSVAGDVFWGTA